ncbi:MAG: hypothetical protein WCC59_18875 [Terriglobales bacterium]
MVSGLASLNLLSAVQAQPGVNGMHANLLPNPSDAVAFAASHRRQSPKCSSQLVIDLRRARSGEVAGASPAPCSGGPA